MTLTKDIFLRAHVVELQAKEKTTSNYNEPKWPEYALLWDTETTLDPKEQALIFGWYRVLRMVNGVYQCVEEGIFHPNDLDKRQLDVIKSYVRSHPSEVTHSDYDENVKVYARSEFVEKIFFGAVKLRALCVAFNASWDISRLAVDYKPLRDRGWSYVLSQREFDVEKLRKNWLTRKWGSTKNGNLRTRCGDYSVTITQKENNYRADVYTPTKEHRSRKYQSSIDAAKLDGFRILSKQVDMAKRNGPVLESNPERPRIRVTAKDSKAAFFSLSKPLRPEEWPRYEITREGEEKPHFCHCGESATHRTADSDSVFLCAKHAKEVSKERGQKVTCIKKFGLIFRVLDLRTLGWALFNESYSLASACEALQTTNKKLDHEPTGMVSRDELDYGRQDVRCTVELYVQLAPEDVWREYARAVAQRLPLSTPEQTS